MNLFKWANSVVKKMDWLDLGLVKISVAAAVLLIAKLWPPILGLDWYWYALVFVIVVIKPMGKVLGK
jgi:uncharacterized membrane protein YdfJ with MMPL/SSD domain